LERCKCVPVHVGKDGGGQRHEGTEPGPGQGEHNYILSPRAGCPRPPCHPREAAPRARRGTLRPTTPREPSEGREKRGARRLGTGAGFPDVPTEAGPAGGGAARLLFCIFIRQSEGGPGASYGQLINYSKARLAPPRKGSLIIHERKGAGWGWKRPLSDGEGRRRPLEAREARTAGVRGSALGVVSSEGFI
jgi:hypothetical protein